MRRSQEHHRPGLENTVRLRCKDLAAVSRPTHRDLPRGLVAESTLGSVWAVADIASTTAPWAINTMSSTGGGVVLTSELDWAKPLTGD